MISNFKLCEEQFSVNKSQLLDSIFGEKTNILYYFISDLLKESDVEIEIPDLL